MSLIRREAITALSLYLGHVHPMLCGGAELGAPLWPSLHKGKPEMTAHGIYTCITQITAAHLGHPVTPHMFRDAAATFIAEMTPERAMMAAAVLQHRNLETTMRHYIHGQQHLAARKYHAAVARGPARGRITRLPKRARSAAEAARATCDEVGLQRPRCRAVRRPRPKHSPRAAAPAHRVCPPLADLLNARAVMRE